MSYAKVLSACMYGSQVIPVTVEADIQPGLPQFDVIGLPDKQIDEARSRVRTAIKNSGLPFPPGRVTVNLAPSNIPKHGTGLDLAIALSVLAAAGRSFLTTSYWVLGELALDGKVQSYQHLFPILLAALQRGVKGCVTPRLHDVRRNLVAIARLESLTLLEVVQALSSKKAPTVTGVTFEQLPSRPTHYLLDTIHGQVEVKRGLAIALAGGHNLCMEGPAGSGKTMLANAAVELLPPLTSYLLNCR
jgi:magnesium chelatase family protein